MIASSDIPTQDSADYKNGNHFYSFALKQSNSLATCEHSLHPAVRSVQTSECFEYPTAPRTFKMLHNAPQTISMGSNEDSLSLFDLRSDHIVPVRQRPGNGVFEALAGRKLVLSQVRIATILRTKHAPS